MISGLHSVPSGSLKNFHIKEKNKLSTSLKDKSFEKRKDLLSYSTKPFTTSCEGRSLWTLETREAPLLSLGNIGQELKV